MIMRLYTISKNPPLKLRRMLNRALKPHGFVRSGNSFYRICGGEIIQIVAFEYESNNVDLRFGLYSIYDSVERRALLVPQYSLWNLKGERWPDGCWLDARGVGHPYIIPPDQQVEYLWDVGISYLDSIQSHGDMIWTDEDIHGRLFDMPYALNNQMFLFAPLLYVGERGKAAEIIRFYIHQNENARLKNGRAFTEQDQRRRDDLLYRLFLATNASKDTVDTWLKDNYRKNLKGMGFLKKQLRGKHSSKDTSL